MDLNQLRKLAGLPPIMEAANVPPKVEREAEKLSDLLEKINDQYLTLDATFNSFNVHLSASTATSRCQFYNTSTA